MEGKNVFNDVYIISKIFGRYDSDSSTFSYILDKQTANKDAEGLVHHLHTESIKKIKKLVNIMKDNPSLLDA